jgi:hypothetical protein
VAYNRHLPAETGAMGYPGRALPQLGVMAAADAAPSTQDALNRAVDYILDDCFFSVGQAVGPDKTIEHAALIWWRDRYRAKFLRTMALYGNRWLADRPRVLSVCRLLGEHAATLAGDKSSIDVDTASKASVVVERFCTSHAVRKQRRLGQSVEDERPEMFAGYWCVL